MKLMNIYVTSEPASKLETLISNIKNFYVFDVQSFIQSLGLDVKKPSNIYYINNEIVSNIISQSRLKKYQGIIYINKNINENIYHNLKKKFQSVATIDKFVLIENGNAPKHKNLFKIFEEVFFYQRFKKNKIIEYNNTVKLADSKMEMVENII